MHLSISPEIPLEGSAVLLTMEVFIDLFLFTGGADSLFMARIERIVPKQCHLDGEQPSPKEQTRYLFYGFLGSRQI